MHTPNRSIPLSLTSATLVALVSLTACGNMSSRDRDTAVGAGAGAVLGSVITGGSTGGAIGGAVLGGVIGHEINKDKR